VAVVKGTVRRWSGLATTHDGCMERKCGKEDCGSNISNHSGWNTASAADWQHDPVRHITHHAAAIAGRLASKPRNSINPHAGHGGIPLGWILFTHLKIDDYRIRCISSQVFSHTLPHHPLLPTALQSTIILSTCIHLPMTSCRFVGGQASSSTVSINLDWAPHDTPTPRHGPDGVHLDIFFRRSDLPLTEEVSRGLRAWWHPYHTREKLRHA
jgi:hypothetical protein